ncbi:MAG TPA: IS66 family transposase [Polyangiaceae bacterium]|jgi:transposase
MRTPSITSPYAPDVEKVRIWLETKIAARLFVEIVTAILALIVRMRDANTELLAKLAYLKRKRPPSETLERLERQLVLPLFGAPQVRKRGPKRTDRTNHPGRAALPLRLERVVVKNEVPAEQRTCPQCGAEMKTVGFSCCERLDVIPAKVVVVRREDETVACPKDDTIVSAPPPPQIVEKGKLGDTLLVESLCDKYIEHTPIERQCTRFARTGVAIAPQTLGHGVMCAIDVLEPLRQGHRRPNARPGAAGIRSGAMWCWTNARWITFFYSPSGDSDSVKRFLGEDLARTVQCDGTSVTTFLERAGGRRPGCWSHGRRGLVEAARVGDRIALEGLRLIARIFAVERAASLAGDTPEERRRRRDEHTRPILDELRAWVDDKREIVAPKTPLGRGLGYLHRQWRRLLLFLDDGNIEATNNRRERELRRLILGRKNWLFTWLDVGGERTARVLSIIATAIAHDVNPRAYLHLVTKLVVGGWPNARLPELLPDRILVAHPDLFVGDGDVLDASSALLSRRH